MIMIKKNSRGRITKINNEAILKRLDNNVFVTEKIISSCKYYAFNVYDLNKNKFIIGYENFVSGVYSFAYRDAVNFARRYK